MHIGLILVLVGRASAQTQCDNFGIACQPGAGECDISDTCCEDGPSCDPPEDICCPCDGPDSFPHSGDPLVPLTDTTDPDFLYEGTHPLGLYVHKETPTGPLLYTNTIPTLHKSLGKREGDQIFPRDADGVFNATTGLVGFLALGFSNVNQAFGDFLTDKIEPLSGTLDGLNDRLVFVNGGIGNNTLCQWDVAYNPLSATNLWTIILGPEQTGLDTFRLEQGRRPGLGNQDVLVDKDQIQVVWVMLVMQNPLGFCSGSPSCPCSGSGACGDCEFPSWVDDGEVPKYESVVARIRDNFPNVRQVFISSMHYSGYANEDVDPDPAEVRTPCGAGTLEPFAYQNSFTVQAMMKHQIADGTLPFSGSSGEHPWLAWGPFLWSTGATLNTTQLAYEAFLPFTEKKMNWECEYSCADGVHPSGDQHVDTGQISGQTQITERLYAFLKNDEVTKEYILEKPIISSTTPARSTIIRQKDKKLVGGSLIDQGPNVIRVKFDKPVYDQVTGSAVGTSSFEIQVTGGTAPTVTSVTAIGSNNDEFDVTLSSQIVPGQWTTLVCKVKDAQGNVIRTNPHDRAHFGFLPGDANANGTVNNGDVTTIEDVLNNPSLGVLALHDINRDGSITSADRSRLLQLLQGTDTTQAWNNYTLPARP